MKTMTDRTILLAAKREESNPRVPSVEMRCESCDAIIVVSLGTKKDAGPNAKPMCLECGTREIALNDPNPSVKFKVGRTQLDEIMGWMKKEKN